MAEQEETRRKPLEDVVLDLSLMYGEPRRVGETYFWHGGGLVMAASVNSMPTRIFNSTLIYDVVLVSIEPAKLIEDEATEIEHEVPADEKESIEGQQDQEKHETPAFEE